MIPVDQVRTGFGKGQCTEASIASLLEVPLEAVPDLWSGIEEGTADEHQPPENCIRMWEWIKSEHNKMLVAVHFTKPFDSIREAYEAAWLEMPVAIADLDHHLAGGHNPDGCPHLVVCNRGVLAHDPNPRRRGIINCDTIFWIVPLERVPEDALHLPAAEWKVERTG